MHLRRPAGTAAGLLTLALAAATPAMAAGPADVTVRVEGESATLVPPTLVRTTSATVNKDGTQGHDCTGTSGAGALQVATGGDWGATWYDGAQYAVDSIKGEAHGFDEGKYWTVWLNDRYSDQGLCGLELQTGDEILLFPECASGCASRTPLRLTGVPATAAPGQVATVKVTEFAYVNDYPQPTVTTSGPSRGATVTMAGRSYTTGDDGTVQLTYDGSGPVTTQATKPDHVRTPALATCVTTGSDGVCGTSKPAASTPAAADKTAPVARVAGIRQGQRFTRKRAPRQLGGAVAADPSGIAAVKLSLTRRYGGECFTYSGRSEEFVQRRCGVAYAFKIGDRADWSYLLPARLKSGRYHLEVTAVDRAGNRGVTERVFTVR